MGEVAAAKLEQRGITSTAALAALLSSQVGLAAPSTLAAVVARVAVGSAGAATPGGFTRSLYASAAKLTAGISGNCRSDRFGNRPL